VSGSAVAVRCSSAPLPPVFANLYLSLSHRLPLHLRYATILAFDVKVTADARIAAEDMGVRIFTADIIYHLTDQFDRYLKESVRLMQEEKAADISFPCICRIIPTAVFNSRNPIVMGMDVLEGTLRIGTPLCVLLEGKSEVCSLLAAVYAWSQLPRHPSLHRCVHAR
jgi:translation initiation factor 5B